MYHVEDLATQINYISDPSRSTIFEPVGKNSDYQSVTSVTTIASPNNAIIHVCPLPLGGAVGGVSFYLQDLVKILASESKTLKQVILCQRANKTWESDPLITAAPTWDFGVSAFSQVDKALRSRDPSIIHVQYEVALFGRVFASFMLPYFISKWRKDGNKVIVTLHHVISKDFDVTQLRFWKKAAAYDPLVLPILRMIQRRVIAASDAIIVHEVAHLKTANAHHATQIPIAHRVLPVKSQKRSIKELNLVFFGFLAEYKGVLELMQAVTELNDEGHDIRLTVIGAEHPRLRKESHYATFISRLRQSQSPDGRVRLVGFIDDSELDEILAVCDAVVLPYKATFSASAALGRAISANAAVITSDVIHTEFSLPESMPTCKPSVAGIKQTLTGINADRLRAARSSSQALNLERSPQIIAKLTLNLYKKLNPDLEV